MAGLLTAVFDALCDHRPMTERGNGRGPIASSRQRAGAGLGALLITAILLAGCGSTTTPQPTTGVPTGTSPGASAGGPSASPAATASPEDPALVYARIEQQVQAIRGLTATRTLTPIVLDPAGLAARLNATFDKDNPASLIAATSQLDQALGLLPTGISLRDELLSMYSTQVAGFYEPDTKQMYVVSRSGGLGPAEKVTFAHEFDHALQDQHFDLTKLGTSVPDQGDRSLARLSLAEGDATEVMYDYLQADLTPADALQMLGQAVDPAQTAALTAMPAYLRDQLLFPYTKGLAFVQQMFARGGWSAVDGVWANPPDSTEQILHLDKYLAHEAPVAVVLPADIASRLGAGWTVALQDTLGEFGLGEWLQVSGGLTADVAGDAAAGWGGDRVALVSGPNGAWGVALVTRWDTSADAAAFDSAATSTAGRLAHGGVFRPADLEVAVIVGSNDDIRGRLANVLGLAG
jgi:hypothetical protein